MKKLLIIIIVLWAGLAGAANYCVQPSGSGSASACSSDCASEISAGTCMDQGDFEGLSGTYEGHTFYFDGTFTSQLDVNISGAGGNYVTLDGYYTNDTTYDDLSEASGRAKFDTNSTNDCIEISGKSYINIQDMEFTDCDGQAIKIEDSSHDINIKRTYTHESPGGLTVQTSSYNVTIGGELGQGNVVKNVGTGTEHEDISVAGGAHDIIISYNHLYADPWIENNANWGIDGVLITTSSNEILVEYNSIHDHNHDDGVDDRGEDGIDIKKQFTHDIIVRFNNIYGHADTPTRSQAGMRAQSGSYQIYVYGNRFYRNRVGFETGDDDYNNDKIYFFSNVVDNAQETGVYVGGQPKTYDTWVFNNTLIGNGTCTESPGGGCRNWSSSTQWANIRVYGVVNSSTIKNNILYKSRPNDNNYQQFYVATNSETKTTADANLYYWPSQTSKIFWGDAGLITLAAVKAGSSNGLPQENDGSKPGTDENPDLEDIDNGDYRIASGTSGAYNTGMDMGSGAIATITIQGDSYPIPWDFGLGPNTVWGSGSTLPVIHEIARDDHQWDRGAYVYTGAASNPVITVATTNDTMNESNPNDQNGQFTIYCNPDCSSTAVNYTLSGSATIEDDYVVTGGDPGTTSPLTITGASDTVDMVVEQDILSEGEEAVIITITSGTGYTLGGTITDTVRILADPADEIVYDYGRTMYN